MMGGKAHGKGRGMMNSRPMMEARLAYIEADLEITDARRKPGTPMPTPLEQVKLP